MIFGSYLGIIGSFLYVFYLVLTFTDMLSNSADTQF